jgi:inorganic pyrophosphatase
LKEIKNFFETYKLLQNKKVIVKGFQDAEWAINEYHECVELMNKYGKLPKDEFIEKMKKTNPQKYEVK